MRITIPAISLELGGGTRALVRIAEGLSRYGHDVTFLIPEGNRVYWQGSVRVLRVPALTPDVFPPADVILPNFWTTVKPAYESGAGKVVRLSMGYEPLWISDPEAARATYRLPIPILAISRWQADLIKWELGREATVIPLGIDQEVFGPPLETWCRDGLLYIWRHKSQGYSFKGSDDFVSAMKTVRSRLTSLSVTLVAPDPYPIEIPFPADICVAPTDQELAGLYQKAKVFVSTSWFEAFSMAPLEAMACGAAVISTDSGGVHEYVDEGRNCLIVPPRSPSSLALAILHVLDSPALAETLGAEGVVTGRRWTWTRTWDAVDNALRRLKSETL